MTQMTKNRFSLVAAAPLDTKLFLAQTLSHADTLQKIPPEEVSTIQQNIAAIAQRLITLKTADLSDEFGLRTQTQTAFTLISIGLEYGSRGDLDRAVRLLRKNRVVKFFQIGNTITDKLLNRARTLLEEAVIHPPTPEEESVLGASYVDRETERIQVYTQTEQEFLKLLLTYRTTISTQQVTIRETEPPRMLVHLSEVNMLDEQLTYIENRAQYVKTLPLESLFTLETPLSVLPDPIAHLTIGLIANLVLYRQVDFRLDAETRRDFHELVYEDGAVRERFLEQLLGWITRYMEETPLPDSVKQYAAAYWEACLRTEGQKSVAGDAEADIF